MSRRKLKRIGEDTAEIIRNKRKGRKLRVKWVKSTESRCIWCCLKDDPFCLSGNKACYLFLPDIIFYEDYTEWRRKSDSKKK